MSESWYAFLGSEARDRNATQVRIENDPRYAALMETLALAVPLRIWELQGRTPQQRCVIAKRCAQEVASHGDTLMFGGKKGEAARVFNALAEGLAAAAYQPGGVTFAGRHWCTDHGRCQRAAEGLPDEPRYGTHCRSCSCEPPDTDALCVYPPVERLDARCTTCGQVRWLTEIHAFHRGSPRRSTHCGCCTHPHDLRPGGHTIPHREYPEAGR